MPSRLKYLLAGVLLISLAVGAVLIARFARPTLPLLTEDSPRARGPRNAPIQIIEYSDFQCPACGKAQQELDKLLQKKGEKIRLIFEHFPLDAHRWSPLAHRAAECAAREGRFWTYHDRLYQTQLIWGRSPEPPVEVFLRFAKVDGLNLEEFAKCLSDPAVAKIIREEKLAGEGLGVRSTPSFFVNGRFVVGIEALRKEVERLIQE
jgi:protein-disulfide isomerase